jgi:hypothetical protein
MTADSSCTRTRRKQDGGTSRRALSRFSVSNLNFEENSAPRKAIAQEMVTFYEACIERHSLISQAVKTVGYASLTAGFGGKADANAHSLRPECGNQGKAASQSAAKLAGPRSFGRDNGNAVRRAHEPESNCGRRRS